MNKLLAGAISILLFVPALASAQSTSSADVTTLQAQLQKLQQQIVNLTSNPQAVGAPASTAPTSPSCLRLSGNLKSGMETPDVLALQKFLAADADAGFTVVANGYFGPSTSKAVMRFQRAHGITPNRGNVGPQTRAFFVKMCTPQGTAKPIGALPDGGMLVGTVLENHTSWLALQTTYGVKVAVDMTASTSVFAFSASTSQPQAINPTSIIVGSWLQIRGQKTGDGTFRAFDVDMGVPQGAPMPPTLYSTIVLPPSATTSSSVLIALPGVATTSTSTSSTTTASVSATTTATTTPH